MLSRRRLSTQPEPFEAIPLLEELAGAGRTSQLRGVRLLLRCDGQRLDFLGSKLAKPCSNMRPGSIRTSRSAST